MIVKKSIVICLIAAFPGCTSQPEPVQKSDPEIYLSALETLELDPAKHESYQKYHDTMNKQMDNWLKRIDNPEQLRLLFWKCHSLWRAKPEAPQEQLKWIDPHADSVELIMYRLAEIGSSDSARVLVELWSDPQAGWDAAHSLGACNAVVKCGNPALPFLKQRKESVPDATRLIRLIETGATRGF